MSTEQTRTEPSFCRNCTAYCPILVTVQDGRAVKVSGDPDAPAYEGYTCPKGRDLPVQHDAAHRLLHSLHRQADGSPAPLASEVLLDAVALRVQKIAARHGPRAVAVYYGTGNVSNPAGAAMPRSWLTALGSASSFQPWPSPHLTWECEIRLAPQSSLPKFSS